MAQQKQAKNGPPPMRRRLKNAALILISQLLLFALAVAWLIHMSLIAAYGSINFVEHNSLILWTEISVSAAIMIFAIFVLVNQIKRLGERRSADRRDRRNPTAGKDTLPVQGTNNGEPIIPDTFEGQPTLSRNKITSDGSEN